MTKERKQEVIETYRRDEKDTGSPEVQIALLLNYLGKKDVQRYRDIVAKLGLRK